MIFNAGPSLLYSPTLRSDTFRQKYILQFLAVLYCIYAIPIYSYCIVYILHGVHGNCSFDILVYFCICIYMSDNLRYSVCVAFWAKVLSTKIKVGGRGNVNNLSQLGLLPRTYWPNLRGPSLFSRQ